MKKHLTTALTLAAGLAATASTASAAAIVASDDTWATGSELGSDGPNAVHGATGKLSLLTTAGPNPRVVVARFALSSLAAGPTDGASSVTFSVDGTTGLTPNPVTSFTFNLYGILDTALEDNLNDATYFGSNNPASAIDSSSNLIRESNTFGNGTVLASVTRPSLTNGDLLTFTGSNLESFLSGFTTGAMDTDGDVAFALTLTADPVANTTARVDLTSTESGAFRPPTLNVTTVPAVVPEPTAAAAILGLGGLTLARRRSRV